MRSKRAPCPRWVMGLCTTTGALPAAQLDSDKRHLASAVLHAQEYRVSVLVFLKDVLEILRRINSLLVRFKDDIAFADPAFGGLAERLHVVDDHTPVDFHLALLVGVDRAHTHAELVEINSLRARLMLRLATG